MATALLYFQRAASHGDAFGQMKLAYCLFFGHGIDLNYNLAFLWCLRAAEHQWVHAYCRMGKLYYYGEGCQKDVCTAVKWLGKSIGEGSFFLFVFFYLFIYLSGVWIDLFEAVIQHTVSAFFEGENEAVTLQICFALGRSLYLDVFDAPLWLKLASDFSKNYAVVALQVFFNLSQLVKSSIFCFALHAKFRLKFPKDVTHLILREVWKSREQPVEAGWYTSHKTTKKIKL
jgi:hypothetical protein